MQDIHVWPFIKLFTIIICLVTSYFIIKQTIVIWYPLVIVISLSYICHPLTTSLTNYLRLPRLFAAIMTVTTIFILITALISFLFFDFIQSTTKFLYKFPEKVDLILMPFANFIKENIFQLYDKFLSSAHQQLLEQQFEQILNQLSGLGLTFLQNILMKMINLLAMFPYSVTILLFVLIATILMTNDWLYIRTKYEQLLPKSLIVELKQISLHFKTTLRHYFQAQLIIVSITAILLTIGLFILQVDNIITIVFITAIVDLLPLIGTAIIFIPWLLYLFIIGNYSLTIGLAILYVVIIIVRQVIEPKIISSQIGIRPLTVLISLFFSFQLFGAIGIIVAPLLMIFSQALYEANVYAKIWEYIKS